MMYTAIRQVSSPIVLWPAYGKRYATVDDLLKGWKDGKDFFMAPYGPLCSVQDLAYIMEEEQPSSIHLQDPHHKVQVRIA